MASLIETCKLNGVNPHASLADTLTKLVNRWPVSRIGDLMPWACAKSPPDPNGAALTIGCVDVVGILLAGRDRHHAPLRDRGHDEQLVARVRRRISDHAGKVEVPRRLAQQDEAAIRGEVAGIPPGCERLSRDQ